MVEVAVVLTDPTGTNVLEEYSAKVLPKKPVDPKAAAVNGYTAEKWAEEAIDLDHAMQKIISMSRNAVFAAHNAPFDWGFLEAAMRPRFMRWGGDYHKVDTVALAWPLLSCGIVESVKLVTLSRHFNIVHEDAHTALADARACREVYVKLMNIFRPALNATLSSVGGA